MKLLIVAHPDDEILWFNPKNFDKIVICFDDREDNYEIYKARQRVLKQHPLKDKIVNLRMLESGYSSDISDSQRQVHQETGDELRKKLKPHIEKADLIYTHNSWGEHQEHPDHIMVHEIVRELAKCPIYCFDGITPRTHKEVKMEDVDLEFYSQVRDLYLKEGAWTWHKAYIPKDKQPYFKL